MKDSKVLLFTSSCICKSGPIKFLHEWPYIPLESFKMETKYRDLQVPMRETHRYESRFSTVSSEPMQYSTFRSSDSESSQVTNSDFCFH